MTNVRMGRLNRVDALSLLIVAGSLATSIAMWDSLPARVPTHFGIDGAPDGYSSRAVGALLGPGIAIVTWLVVRFGTRALPVGDARHGAGSTHTTSWLACALAAFMTVIHIAALRATSTGRLPTSIFSLAIGGLCLAFTALFPRLRRNAFVGVRTPWALASDENWARTHRVASFSMLAASLAAFGAPLVAPSHAIRVAVVSLIAAALAPALYSASLARHPST